ncbi:MAG: hypothetical protein WC606_03830 [Candidatus Absconditabacterales bacterium]|jgi:hypothetical protein
METLAQIHNRNVALLFYKDKEEAIKEIRKTLFANLTKYHPAIAIAVEKLLDERIKKSASPLMGELYPHIVYDLVSGIPAKDFKEVSAQWLAAYVLTVMIDDVYDIDSHLKGALIAPLHLETSKLYKKVVGTRYSDMFDELVFSAIQGQINDSVLQKQMGNHEQKLVSAGNKNKILTAFSCVIASMLSNQPKGDFVINFTNNFLLGFQMLDDISDFESDYSEGNKTYLLSFEQKKFQNRKTLLEGIILSGTFNKTLDIVLTSLNKGFEMIQNENVLTVSYFHQLIVETKNLKKLISSYTPSKLDEIDKQIKIICQST